MSKGADVQVTGRARMALLVVVALVGSTLVAIADVATRPDRAEAAEASPGPGGPFAIEIGATVTDGAINGAPVVGAGRLETKGDEDVYTFDVSAPGERVFFDRLSGFGFQRWSLIDATGRQYFENENFDEYGPVFLPTGSYRLTARSYTATHGMLSGPYSFTLWPVPGRDSFPLTLGPPGTGVTVSNGVPAAGAGNIEAPYAVDEYPFTVGGTGKRVHFNVEQTCACYFSLRDSSQRSIGEYSNDSLAPVYLPAGNYIASVRGRDAVHAVTYRFKLWTVAEPETFTGLTLGANISNGIPTAGAGNIETPASHDVYAYQLAAGTRVTLVGSNHGGMHYAMFRPDGSQILSSPVPSSTDPVVDITTTGVYKVVAQAVNYSGPRTYTLSLLNTPTAVVTDAPTTFPVTLPTAGQTLAVPAALPASPSGGGNIESPTSEDVFTFDGAAGQAILLQGVAAPSGITWELRQPNGAAMFMNVAANTTRGPLTLPETGRYSLTVSSQNSATGNYSFNLSTVIPPHATTNPAAYPITLGTSPGAVVSVPTDVPAQYSGAGNLEGPGSEDTYSFQANGGQTVYLQGSANRMWYLRGPDGRSLFADSPTAVTWSGDIGRITFSQTGTHTLRVTGGTGSYSFSMTPATTHVIPIAVGDEVGVDALGAGFVKKTDSNGATTTTPTPGAGELTYAGERDLYTFEGAAGQRIYLQHTAPSTLIWEVRDPTGALLPRHYYGYIDSFSFVDMYGGLDSDWSTLLLPRSGRYSIVAKAYRDGSAIDTYGFKVLDASAPPVEFPIDLPAVGATLTKSGNIGSPTASDVYTFVGHAGQKVKFDAPSQGGLQWTLTTPRGFVAFDQYLTSAGVRTLAESGEYRLAVRYGHVTSGYSFTLTTQAAPVTPEPLAPDVFPIGYDETVDVNAPGPGAARLEVAGASDVYQFEAVSGDTIAIDGTCWIDPYPYWNLRAPNGEVLYANRLCQIGPMVLPIAGTYQLFVGNAPAPLSYSFTLHRVRSIQEPPLGDPSVHLPKVTRVDPATGAAGGTTTFDVYGSRLPKITAVHIRRDSGPDLPINIEYAGAVNTNVEARAATVQVDLKTVTNAADYSISVGFADGTTMPVPGLFRVTSGITPAVEIDIASRNLVPAAVNYAFVNIHNPTVADYYHGAFSIEVPCDGTSVTGGNVVYPTTVRLIVPPVDLTLLVEYLEAQGVDEEVIAEVEAIDFPEVVAPDVDQSGVCRFQAYVPTVPSGGTVSLKLEIVPPTPAGVHQTGQLGPITVNQATGGPHLRSDGLDSPMHAIVAATATQAGLPVPSAAAVAAAASFFRPGPHVPPPGSPGPVTSVICAMAILVMVFVFKRPHPGVAPACTIWVCTITGCLPNPPVTPPIAPPHDPNDISAPATVVAGDEITYTVNFENYGPGDAQWVDAVTNLDPDVFEPSTFRIDAIGVGHEEITPVGNASLVNGSLPVNDTTVAITSSLALADNAPLGLEAGDLRVQMRGATNDNQPVAGDFLPANTDANRPAGQGFIRFTVKTRADLPVDFEIEQQAKIIFNPYVIGGGDVTPTNVWKTTVVAPLPERAPAAPLSFSAKSTRIDPGRALVRWRPARPVGGVPPMPVDRYVVYVNRSDRSGNDLSPKVRLAEIAPADALVMGGRLGAYITIPIGDPTSPLYDNSSSSYGFYEFTMTAENGRGASQPTKVKKRPVFKVPATTSGSSAVAASGPRAVWVEAVEDGDAKWAANGTLLIATTPLKVDDNYGGCTSLNLPLMGLYTATCQGVQEWNIDLGHGNDTFTGEVVGRLYVNGDSGAKRVVVGSRTSSVHLLGGYEKDELRVTRAIGRNNDIDGDEGDDVLSSAVDGTILAGPGADRINAVDGARQLIDCGKTDGKRNDAARDIVKFDVRRDELSRCGDDKKN